MSAYNKHIFNLNPTGHWLLLSPKVDQTSFSCRIGFVGDPIDRSDQELTGKIMGQRRFERESDKNTDCMEATNSVKAFLANPINDSHLASSQYVLAAQLSGNEEALKKEQLKLAVDWLKSQNVNAIFFQYQWMLSEIKGTKEYSRNPEKTLAVP